MPALRLLTAVSASFLLLAKANAAQTITYNLTLGTDEKCLSEINTARQNAGFNEFAAAKNGSDGAIWPTAGDKASGEYADWVWKPVCDVLLGEKADTAKAKAGPLEAFLSGTYAFKAIDGESPNCTEIVDGWNAAYTNFDGIPPPKSKNEKLYQVPENVSFVAMYNPSTDAAASCRVVTCTKTVSGGEGRRSARVGSEEQQGTTKGSALMCLTTPDILFTKTETAPFTEDQWGQIVTAFEGSASTALPTLLGVAAAVLGVVATV